MAGGGVARGVSLGVEPPTPAVQSAEPTASPTLTPLPPPVVPPPDAAGISATTPPIGDVSPHPQPTVADTLWLATGDASTIPLTLHGGRPFVSLVVDGVRHEFMLSSLRASVIDAALPYDVVGGQTVLRTVQIGDVRLTNVKVSRERVAPFAQTYLGTPASGILGSEIFSHYPVTIDYPNRTLTIFRTEAAASLARPAGAAVTQMEMVAGMPAVTCAVDGLSVAPCFIEVHSAADLWLYGPGRWKYANEPAMAIRDAEPGGEMRGTIVRARTLRIGNLDLAGALVDLSPAGQAAYAVAPARAMLGSGVFARFAITIDEPAGTFTLAGSPAAAAAPSPFDGSGMWLVWRGGTITVRSVVPKSPADAADIVGGDVIVAINGKPALDLDAARDAFTQPSGTRVGVTYQRGARRKDVVLTLHTLI